MGYNFLVQKYIFVTSQAASGTGETKCKRAKLYLEWILLKY